MSGPKGTKIGPALQWAVRGTFCPKDGNIYSLPTHLRGGEGRCLLFYIINKPHWGSGANPRACQLCDQDTVASPSIEVAGDSAGGDKGESGLCVDVERPLCR